MMPLNELRQLASKHNVVALTGFDHNSTEHRDYVPSCESLRWIAIRESDLAGREIAHLGASTSGTYLQFKDGAEFEQNQLAFAHAETEAEALQEFLEEQGILQETRYESFWDSTNGHRTVIAYDPNIQKVHWFDGEWIASNDAIDRFAAIIKKLESRE